MDLALDASSFEMAAAEGSALPAIGSKSSPDQFAAFLRLCQSRKPQFGIRCSGGITDAFGHCRRFPIINVANTTDVEKKASLNTCRQQSDFPTRRDMFRALAAFERCLLALAERLLEAEESS